MISIWFNDVQCNPRLVDWAIGDRLYLILIVCLGAQTPESVCHHRQPPLFGSSSAECSCQVRNLPNEPAGSLRPKALHLFQRCLSWLAQQC